MTSSNVKSQRQIRAVYDSDTITVYQAYNDAIADSALEAQTFVPPHFKMDRMTWIKPSFLWMAYRSGWASKPNQTRVLAIKIKRSGFDWALMNSSVNISHDENGGPPQKMLDKKPVRIQWDPEKSLSLENLPIRSIQIGLKDEAKDRYVNDWIVEIREVTEHMKEIGSLVERGEIEKAKELLPKEEVYPISDEIAEHIRAVNYNCSF